jgi:hydroxylamine reductase
MQDMFCMQCEQTEGGTGCTTVGVCGKTPETAGLQDVLVENVKGISMYSHLAREMGCAEDTEVNRFSLESMFSTMTNVNFDSDRFVTEYIPKSVELKNRVKDVYLKACADKGVAPEDLTGTPADFNPTGTTEADFLEHAKAVGVLERRAEHGDVLSGLQELVTYGIKGTAAYANHAKCLGSESPTIYSELQRCMYILGKTPDMDTLVKTTLDVGKANLEVLALLDSAHTGKFGNPVPTSVKIEPIPGKCILVSGHDMPDLVQILEQTKGKGINVYTHGELLPAHSYPELQKYDHLVGNYGGAWQFQKFEFAKFPGPVVVTTNCIIEPRKSYSGRIYTTNVVGWPGVTHIPDTADGNKDFSGVVEQALAMDGFTSVNAPASDKAITVGFGHHTILSIADQVIAAVKAGHIKHFFLIGGCDGSEGERNYYKELAQKTPEDTVILTLGCGKYRFNKLDLGVVPNTGIPRVLDMGQCNDSYGAVVVASALADAFGTDVNGLPLSFAVSWFEQKAVAVLLTLLHLNVQNIALGPNLPAFVTPEVGAFLTETFGLRGADVDHVDADIKKYLS